MKPFTVPNRKPSRKCAIAAISGDIPAVVVQDETGSQVVVTPKMARTLSRLLKEFANVAEGKADPDLSRGKILPATGYLM